MARSLPHKSSTRWPRTMHPANSKSVKRYAKGGVELSGFINTSWERDAAVKLASENASVNGIVNSIDIMRERPESINKNQGE